MAGEMKRASVTTCWAIFITAVLVLPISGVLLGYWFFGVSLPTLMFISFVLLFLGAFFCYPTDREPAPEAGSMHTATRSEAVVLLMLGQSSALGVLIVLGVRLYQQGMLFTWM